MRKAMMVVVLMMLMVLTARAAEQKFNVLSFDDPTQKPFGVGVATWSDKHVEFQPAIYGHLGLFNWDEKVRFNSGLAVTWSDSGSKVKFRLTTGISVAVTVAGVPFEVGAYYAPLYRLYDSYNNDPWGFMVGVLF